MASLRNHDRGIYVGPASTPPAFSEVVGTNALTLFEGITVESLPHGGTKRQENGATSQPLLVVEDAKDDFWTHAL